MQILNVSELTDFQIKHSNSRSPLDKWQKIVLRAAWKNFSDLRNDFRSADYVKGNVVFNIGGNNYRMVAWVHYHLQRIRIIEIMTHSEYDRWTP